MRRVLTGSLILASLLLFLAWLRAPAPPSLFAVGPYPGSTVGVARPPVAALFSESRPSTVACLFLDGLPRQLATIRRPLLTFSVPRLLPGRHRFDLAELSLGGLRAFHWWATVVRHPLPALPKEDPSGYLVRAALNAARRLAGVPPLSYDGALAAAAMAHAHYFRQNVSNVRTITLAAHQESPDRPGFVGRGPLARDTFFGFWGEAVSEVMAFGVMPQAAVDLWLDSVYHRLGVLDPNLTVMGFGSADGTSPYLPVTVANLGAFVPRPLPTTRATLFPGPDQHGVPTSFEAGEVPDPLDSLPKASYPLGYPITVSFFAPSVKTVRDVRATLKEHGRIVPVYLLTPANDVHRDELGASIVLLKTTPLRPHTEYQVEVALQVVDQRNDAHPVHLSYRFFTA